MTDEGSSRRGSWRSASRHHGRAGKPEDLAAPAADIVVDICDNAAW
jgi:hypothetical protein